KPLMTCYLTDETDPDDVEHGFKEGVFTAVKLYPAHATTYSAAGVTDHRKIMPVLERMEKIGMPFLMHGEDVDPEVDIFDRQAMCIERYLSKWISQFPGLRFVLEHLSSKDAVDFVRSAARQGGGSIPGLFNAPVAIETYAKVFEEEGALDKLETFASLNGPKHYRLPPNEATISLEKTAWTAPAEVKIEGPDAKALVYRGGETIEWK